jgi:cell wall-associated NlpC family hydrolase
MFYKKLLSTCITLAVCLAAISPVYKQHEAAVNPVSNSINEQYVNSQEKQVMMQKLLSDSASTAAEPIKAVQVSRGTTEVKRTPVKTVPTSKATTTIKKKVSTPSVKRSTTSTRTTSARTTTSSKTSRSTVSEATSSKASAIINTAKSLLGVPYVWGGASPSGVDCSGFIQYVFGKNGISMPRTAADQYKVGTSISKGDLRPGDLVFFETYKPGASHVGIYLGSGSFIHASSGKGEVTISNLSSSYYTSHYLGSRRVI